jgi:hypothetical protein
MLLVVSASTLVVARGANAQVVPPALRINLVSTGPTQIGLIWSAVSGASGYVLQCSTNPQFSGGIQVGPSSGTSYVFKSLTPATTYYFRAYSNAPTPSGWSSVLTVATPAYQSTPTPGPSPTPTQDEQRYDLMKKILSTSAAAPPTPTPTPSAFGKATCGGVAATTMVGGQSLTAGKQIFSPSGGYRLRYQPDANLVLYIGNTTSVVWATNKNSGNPGRATMQPDGNFVTYDGSGVATWSTGTYGRTGVWLALQDDGNLVLYQGACTPIWRR